MAFEQPPFPGNVELADTSPSGPRGMWDQSGKSEREEGETPAIAIVSLGRKPRSQTIGIRRRWTCRERPRAVSARRTIPNMSAMKPLSLLARIELLTGVRLTRWITR